MVPSNKDGCLAKSFFESLEERVLFDGVPNVKGTNGIVDVVA